ncbi:HAMP domain-containing sensor histidine kinase [Actinacidiphila glaucinigra]|uniref:sensor histidine kinase n=1 Tax=Actinacidiphila glaucinigra TaxID=235986 RepID=UPI0033B567FD
MRSVRARTALSATAVVGVALVLAGLGLVLALRANLTGQAGLRAEVAAREVAAQIAAGTPYDRLDLPDGDEYPVRVTDGGGTLLAAGEDVRRVTGAPVPDPDDDGDTDTEAEYGTGTATVDGRQESYRFAALSGERGGERWTVTAGASLSAEQDAVRTAVVFLLAGLPVMLAVVWTVTWLGARNALRPVEAIRAEMEAITSSTDLSRRVPVPPARDEVARLARATNETLTALQAAVERQRRFVADASHELRSPIAALRTELEVAAAHPALLDLDSAVDDVTRLQALASDLLLLARFDAGEETPMEPVALDELAREKVALRPGAVPVTVEAPDTVTVRGDRQGLERVLDNLLDNARRHATGSVAVRVTRDAGWAVLEVTDDGPGIPEADRERVFDRFIRLDESRTRDAGGAGLGLAIVRDIVHRHGGYADAGSAPQGGALLRVRLPSA